jgi:UDP-3-O-[3-hydroxymyristoyl] glucosamine N-acyltransferase
MATTVGAVARALDAPAEGDLALEIDGAAEPAQAGPRQLALAMDPKYRAALGQGAARAALLAPGTDWRALGLEAAIFVARPRLALAGLTGHLAAPPDIAPGIHPTAVIDPAARIGRDAAIGPFAVVGPGAVLGAGARLGPHVSIGAGARIGDGALLHAGVRIAARVQIGARFIAHPGAVVGGDGFSFVTPEPDAIEAVRRTMGDREGFSQASYLRIASLGAVRLGDDVELGCNACIDRGTIRDTTVGDGTKIDNLVQIGHNCQIGRDCLLCGHAGLAGSVRLGDRVVIGGKVGVADNLIVGDDAIVAGGSGVTRNIPAGQVVFGYPAVKMAQSVEQYKALRRLPRMMARLARGQKPVPPGDESA